MAGRHCPRWRGHESVGHWFRWVGPRRHGLSTSVQIFETEKLHDLRREIQVDDSVLADNRFNAERDTNVLCLERFRLPSAGTLVLRPLRRIAEFPNDFDGRALLRSRRQARSREEVHAF